MKNPNPQRQEHVQNLQKIAPAQHTVTRPDPKAEQKLRLTLLAQVLSH